MAGSPDLRASDADRERTADELRRHAGEGRLDPQELDERLTRAYSARTSGELAELTRDLPVRDDRAPRPARPPFRSLGPLLFPPLVCTLIWLATGADSPFWPIWVFLGVGIAALAKGLGVAGHHDRGPRLPRPPEPPEPPEVSGPR